MGATKRIDSTLPGEKNREKKTILKHEVRLIDICDQLLKDPDTDKECFFDYVRELRKELSKSWFR